MDKEQLIEKCRFYASDALSEAQKWQYETGTMRITRLLNAEHSVGKFHAYLEVLEETDIDAFAEIYDETTEKIVKALEIVENIYYKSRVWRD